jgi:hypothetical protein
MPGRIASPETLLVIMGSFLAYSQFRFGYPQGKPSRREELFCRKEGCSRKIVY